MPYAGLPHTACAPAGLWLLGAWTRPYGLSELEAWRASCGYAQPEWGVGLSMMRFGLECYSENTTTIDCGFRIFDRVSNGLGGSMHYTQYRFESYQQTYQDYSAVAGIALKLHESLHLGLLQRGLPEYFYAGDTADIVPLSSAGVIWIPYRGLELGCNIIYCSNDYALLYSLSAGMLDCLRVRSSYSPQLLDGSFGIELVLGNVSTSYAMRYHPYLGLSHSVAAGATSETPRFARLNFSRSRKPVFSGPAIDLTTCSAEDLDRAGGMGGIIARRCIQYRKTRRCAQQKSPGQHGLHHPPGDLTIRHSTGEPQPVPRAATPRTITRRQQVVILLSDAQRQQLFQKLVAAGMPAPRALHFARSTLKLPLPVALNLALQSDFYTTREKELLQKSCQ
jgi:hypothetical protein